MLSEKGKCVKLSAFVGIPPPPPQLPVLMNFNDVIIFTIQSRLPGGKAQNKSLGVTFN